MFTAQKTKSTLAATACTSEASITTISLTPVSYTHLDVYKRQAWAYLKTNNIWVPVLLHYFNNNLIVVYTNSTEISNQVIPWSDVLIMRCV